MIRTYGTVAFKEGSWVIAGEAHVMMRAKRVFGQAGRTQMGLVTIAATPSATRDLAWFLERFPMVVDDPERLATLARRHDDAMAVVQAVLERRTEPPTFDLAVPPREYQRVAAHLAIATGRLLLCDDLGLGKTCSAICAISEANVRPAVVVTMTHLPAQWAEQFRKFAPSLRVWSPKKRTPTHQDLELLRGFMRPDVIILSYSKLQGWAETLVLEFGARSVVFDEAQELRHGRGTGKGAGASHVAEACALRMGLTATPVYNKGGEVFNILNILEKGCLGEWGEFQTEWGGDWVQDPKALGSHLREAGLLLRRVGADVVDEVPELARPMRIPHLVDADARAIAHERTASAELARILLSATGKGIDKMKAAGELDWRMRQATGIAKAPFVAEFVRMILASEPKVLLYGWHHAVYGLWRDALREFDPVCFTGEESPTQKAAAIQRFVGGQSRVLIMSLRSGAGIDGLQEVSRCIVFGELDWSPGVHDQCIGRLNRPGQQDTVRAFFLHAEDGADPFMVEVLGLKTAQAAGVVDPLAPTSEEVGDRTEHIRMLAEACLRGIGETVEQATMAGATA